MLDERVPHTSVIELQDSLQRLANLPEEERLKIIDKVIEDLKKKEKEEREALEEAEAEKTLQQQQAMGGGQTQQQTAQKMTTTTTSGGWYFYNPQAVNQGKQVFQRLWGKRENKDDWQRANLTVLGNISTNTEDENSEETTEATDSISGEKIAAADSIKADSIPVDTAANDPHNREYYLAQIPFTEEQKAASDNLIKDALLRSGIIFKDKLYNLGLSHKALNRLTTQYADYEHNDEALYHLFLLYSLQGRKTEADNCVELLKQKFPESDWTILLSDPYFAENQRFGIHIEDSLYAATYSAFKEDKLEEIKSNADISEKRFPLGQHRPKFLFIEGLSMLNAGEVNGCIERLQQVVEKYPQSEVSELAGMIVKGVQQGRELHGGKFDIGDVWSRRDAIRMSQDSTRADTLSIERDVKHVFLLAYHPDSISQNQLLYEMAKYNFSNYLVRNFEIVTDQDQNGLCRMIISGFLSYDEARQYAHQLHTAKGPLEEMLRHCRNLIVSEQNLTLLGSAFSYADYELFFEKKLAPIEISKIPLLDEPEVIIQEQEEEEPAEDREQQPVDDLFNDGPQQQNGGGIDFDDDFWR